LALETRERDVPRESKATTTVPPEIERRFVRVGREFYFPDGARAFSDRGRKLTTPSENTEVIRSLIEIARARGWQSLGRRAAAVPEGSRCGREGIRGSEDRSKGGRA
jgi:hypothetical protein